MNLKKTYIAEIMSFGTFYLDYVLSVNEWMNEWMNEYIYVITGERVVSAAGGVSDGAWRRCCSDVNA